MLSITAKTEGVERVIRALEAITPSKNHGWIHTALKKAALQVQNLAKFKYIIPGGRWRVPGSKTKYLKPVIDPIRITSRTNTLRDEIKVDLTRSPKSVDIGVGGAARRYGPVHELGARSGKPHKRPYLAPALTEAAKSFQALFTAEWRKQLPK